MENTKLLNRLRFLSEQEIKDFILFAESPYFNSNAALVRLLKYLQKYHPELKGSKTFKELVYKKVFPKKDAYKEKRLNDLMTQLFQLSQDFLAFNHLKKSPLARKRHELLAYRERDMKKDFQKTAASAKELLKKEIHDENYNVEKYLLEKEIVLFQSSQETKKDERQFKPVFNALDDFFFREKLIFATITKNREKTLTRSYNISLLKEISNITIHTKSEKDFNHFLVRFIDVQESENEVELEKLIKLFKELNGSLSLRYAQMVLYIFINIFLRKFRLGDKKVISIIFDLYQFATQNNFLVINNKIDEATFINVGVVAEVANQKEWLNNFIQQNQQYISPRKNEQNTVNLTWATILYHRVKNNNDPEIVQHIHNQLNNLEFTVPSYSYRVKSMLIRLYFSEFLKTKEFSYYRFIEDTCKAFENQLYRDTAIHKHKNIAYLSFSKIIKRLTKYIYDNENGKILKLISEIEEIKLIFDKEWLIAQAKKAYN